MQHKKSESKLAVPKNSLEDTLEKAKELLDDTPVPNTYNRYYLRGSTQPCKKCSRIRKCLAGLCAPCAQETTKRCSYCQIIKKGIDDDGVCDECIPLLVPKTALDVQTGGDHYKKMKIQPVEFIEANKLGFCEGNVVKYISRHQFKNGREDIKKVIHYCELILMRYDNED